MATVASEKEVVSPEAPGSKAGGGKKKNKAASSSSLLAAVPPPPSASAGGVSGRDKGSSVAFPAVLPLFRSAGEREAALGPLTLIAQSEQHPSAPASHFDDPFADQTGSAGGGAAGSSSNLLSPVTSEEHLAAIKADFKHKYGIYTLLNEKMREHEALWASVQEKYDMVDKGGTARQKEEWGAKVMQLYDDRMEQIKAVKNRRRALHVHVKQLKKWAADWTASKHLQ